MRAPSRQGPSRSWSLLQPTQGIGVNSGAFGSIDPFLSGVLTDKAPRVAGLNSSDRAWLYRPERSDFRHELLSLYQLR